MKQKQIWIPEPLHRKLKKQCATRRPKVFLGDYVALLLEKGAEALKTENKA